MDASTQRFSADQDYGCEANNLIVPGYCALVHISEQSESTWTQFLSYKIKVENSAHSVPTECVPTTNKHLVYGTRLELLLRGKKNPPQNVHGVDIRSSASGVLLYRLSLVLANLERADGFILTRLTPRTSFTCRLGRCVLPHVLALAQGQSFCSFTHNACFCSLDLPIV